jgi:hypothetical protein
MTKTFLLVAAGVMLGYTWCYSVPTTNPVLNCDDVIEYPNGALVCEVFGNTDAGCDEIKDSKELGFTCEIFIRESSIDKVKKTNQVTEGDRI